MTDDSAREVVLREGVETTDGSCRYINPGAITWEEPVPIMVRGETEEVNIYGTMTDIRREDDGRITALCTPPIQEGMYLGADLVAAPIEEVTASAGNPRLVFTGGRLAAATIQDHQVWPEE